MPEPTKPLKLWYQWKSLRLPWRKKWLCGYDLSGHTFWEFVDPLNHGRPRRIVHYPRSTHYGDVAMSPAWLQWLRKTRAEAPSIAEQQMDLNRQSNMKQLAAQADQRWREQESYLDKPENTGQTQPLMQPLDKGGYNTSARTSDVPGAGPGHFDEAPAARESAQNTSQPNQTQGGEPSTESLKHKSKGEKPWKTFEKGPSETWQPESWSPGRVEQR